MLTYVCNCNCHVNVYISVIYYVFQAMAQHFFGNSGSMALQSTPKSWSSPLISKGTYHPAAQDWLPTEAKQG